MSDYINYGKAGIFVNEDADEKNKRPHLTGTIEITADIPKGTKLRIAGWNNYQGDKLKSIGLNLSSKVGGEDDTYEKQKDGKPYTAKVDENLPF